MRLISSRSAVAYLWQLFLFVAPKSSSSARATRHPLTSVSRHSAHRLSAQRQLTTDN